MGCALGAPAPVRPCPGEAKLHAAPGRRVDSVDSRNPVETREARFLRRRDLARDDLIQATGTVEKILGGGRYRIVLETGQEVTAQLSGRMRRFRIRVIPGDRVQRMSQKSIKIEFKNGNNNKKNTSI